jgi:formate dehydrogenase subunit gamma
MMKKKTSQNRTPKKLRRYVRRRDAMDAASRFYVAEDGTRYVIRFTWEQRIQHWILLLSFTTLGVTGLAQTFYATAVGNFILLALGGIDSARQIHHVAAFIFGTSAIYHFAISIYETFVYRRISRIWPDWSDFTNLIDMLKLNLGLTDRHPKFDRFTFEEKAEYWALIWGTIIMGATGLMQWFPLQVTSILPGWAIPVARAFHRWEAILAVLAILTWHFYHTLVKTRNFSIFSGMMTIAQMEEEHPIELAYLERAALALESSKTWPALIEILLEEEEETAPSLVSEKTIEKVEGKTGVVASVQAVEEASQGAGVTDVIEGVDKMGKEESASAAVKEAPIAESLSGGEA